MNRLIPHYAFTKGSDTRIFEPVYDFSCVQLNFSVLLTVTKVIKMKKVDKYIT